MAVILLMFLTIKEMPIPGLKHIKVKIHCYITIDTTQSGVVYLADGRKIYKSVNNGYTFSEYKSLPSKLIGIYKKPNSEIIYAASKSRIFKITPGFSIQ